MCVCVRARAWCARVRARSCVHVCLSASPCLEPSLALPLFLHFLPQLNNLVRHFRPAAAAAAAHRLERLDLTVLGLELLVELAVLPVVTLALL